VDYVKPLEIVSTMVLSGLAKTDLRGKRLQLHRILSGALLGFAIAASARTTTPLAGQHAVRIVRFGPKTLLVGVSSAGCTTLAEIADPQATARIAAACRGGQRPLQASATRTGHTVLKHENLMNHHFSTSSICENELSVPGRNRRID
jgi:hypothetical protein